jgi:putative hydrolase of the HAD superfamily
MLDISYLKPDIPNPKTMQALLLDFGSVISKSLFERLPQVEKKLGLPKGYFRWRGSIDPDSDPLWMAMQRDEISERTYWKLRSEEIGKTIGHPNWDFLDLMNHVRDQRYSDILRSEALAAIDLCKNAGLKVGVLSNELALFYGETWVEQLPFKPKLDCFIDATHNNILKPDPLAYQLAISPLGVPAKEILFVDDQLRNISGAIRVGMRTLHFDIAHPKAGFDYVLQVMRVKNSVHISGD